MNSGALGTAIDVGSWLREHPKPSGEELARAGVVAPHWPPPWGLGADAATARAIDEQLAAAGVVLPDNPIGIGWAGPTLLVAGTDAHHDRHLFPILSGAELWCQLFSEPDAGSDPAALRGWRLARVTLGNERVSLSSGGIIRGMGPTGAEVLAPASAVGVTDPVLRQEVARCHTEAVLSDLLGQRAREAVVAGGDPGPVASLKKLLADEHGQRLMELVARPAGADAVEVSGHPWPSAHHPAPVGGRPGGHPVSGTGRASCAADALIGDPHVRVGLLASLDVATALELSTFHSRDPAEAVDAARERRPPRFEGR